MDFRHQLDANLGNRHLVLARAGTGLRQNNNSFCLVNRGVFRSIVNPAACQRPDRAGVDCRAKWQLLWVLWNTAAVECVHQLERKRSAVLRTGKFQLFLFHGELLIGMDHRYHLDADTGNRHLVLARAGAGCCKHLTGISMVRDQFLHFVGTISHTASSSGAHRKEQQILFLVLRLPDKPEVECIRKYERWFPPVSGSSQQQLHVHDN